MRLNTMTYSTTTVRRNDFATACYGTVLATAGSTTTVHAVFEPCSNHKKITAVC